MNKADDQKVLGRAGVTIFLLLLSFFLMCRLFPSPLPQNISWSTKVVDRKGEVLRVFTTPLGYWRYPAQLEEIDPLFIKQLIAFEDKRFWDHPGVDFLALVRACWQLARTGHIVSGASTITMQTVRLLQPKPRTVGRKLFEMAQAVRLEMMLSKEEILELYLSLTPYGGNIQGIEAACSLYFNIEPNHLTSSQSALLISLPQAPEQRRPDRHPQAAMEGRNNILQRLFNEGLVSRSELELAQRQPVPTQRHPVPFIAAQLSARLHGQSPSETQIACTLDAELQEKVEVIGSRFQKSFSDEKSLAILVVDNKSREVLVYVGSGDFRLSQMDLTRAVRSPGSTLKPFIYGMAFEQGFLHPETKIYDGSRRFGSYGPENFDKGFHGWVSVREALQQSLNIPAVRVLDRVGSSRLLARMNRVGVDFQSHGEPGLSLALGGVGCSLHDLVSLYSALANQGMYTPLFIMANQLGERDEAKMLLSSTAAWYVDDVLSTVPLPGYHPELVSENERIRAKTGTSYGFRDAWAVGYNQDYTVGVWTGQIDGSYGRGATGLNTAVPILLQVFTGLPGNGVSGNHWPKPKNAMLVRHADLPLGLQWYGKEIPSPTPVLKPTIAYPVNESSLEFSDNLQIPLKVNGGTPPLYWLANGKIIGKTGEGARMVYKPDKPGAVTITLVDSRGKRDKIRMWLK